MPSRLAKVRIAAFAVVLAVCWISTGFSAMLQPDDKTPVKFEAKQISHDDEAQTVTAAGDVEFVQGPRILRADKVVYHLDTDIVEAEGNVSVLDEDGSVHFADSARLSQDLKNGFVKGLLSMMADGSRFTAETGQRDNGAKTVMTKATYTPCKVCETDPHPTWQIKADSITHDEETKDISYKNARFEFMGVPMLYTPIFSHADPSVKSRSGFLRPSYSWSNNLGASAEGGYYWSISPDKDATLMVRPTTREGVLTQGEWRERFQNGQVKFDGSFAQSDRKEEDGRVEPDKLRGDFFANGLFDLNTDWRAGFDVKRVSDKSYLRLYDIDKSNILQNDIYAERFDGRDYSRIAAINAQDLRLGLRPTQPEVLPMAEHHMLGEPQSLLGGRWSVDMSALDLQRLGPGQDMQRASVRTGWERRDISSSTGFVTTYDASVGGDSYAIQHNALALNDNTTATRGQAVADVTESYPMVKRAGRAQWLVEPVVGLSAATHANNKALDIPNEDSKDVQIDPSSLFSSNRFPGTDREEDGERVNYGVKTGVYGDEGAYGRVFVGQSYRFDNNDGLFPEGSGLENHLSDLVGQVSTGISDKFNADYIVQLDHKSLAAHRHEVEMSGGGDKLRLDTRFIYLDAIAGTGFIQPREQWQLGGSYKFNQKWSFATSSLYDLGDEPGLRRATAGFNYADECFSFGIQGIRNLITDTSGQSGTSVMVRLGFKNVGEFQGPQIMLKPMQRPPGQ